MQATGLQVVMQKQKRQPLLPFLVFSTLALQAAAFVAPLLYF